MRRHDFWRPRCGSQKFRCVAKGWPRGSSNSDLFIPVRSLKSVPFVDPLELRLFSSAATRRAWISVLGLFALLSPARTPLLSLRADPAQPTNWQPDADMWPSLRCCTSKPPSTTLVLPERHPYGNLSLDLLPYRCHVCSIPRSSISSFYPSPECISAAVLRTKLLIKVVSGCKTAFAKQSPHRDYLHWGHQTCKFLFTRHRFYTSSCFRTKYRNNKFTTIGQVMMNANAPLASMSPLEVLLT